MGFFSLFKKSRKATLINGILTVILNDNSKTTLVFHGATQSTYDYVLNKDNDDVEITRFYYDFLEKQKKEKVETTVSSVIAKKEEKKAQEIQEEKIIQKELAVVKEMKEKYPTLLATGDFIENDGSLYLKNIPNLSIPSLLIKRFITLVQGINKNIDKDIDEYCALKNFWMWCSLNPNPESRENLFRFIENNKLKINKYGFFASYRRVVSKGIENQYQDNDDEEYDDEVASPKQQTNKELSEAISAAYLKVKSQKKSPKNFSLYNNTDNPTEYKVIASDKIATPAFQDANNVVIGNIYELYMSLSEGEAIIETPEKQLKVIPVQTYTDAHTHKMDIRIGKEVSMPPEQCNWDNHQSCSSGLHICSKDGHGCGDTLLIVLVNPMKVASVPYSDGSKARCWAYFPVAVANGFGSLDNIDTLELGDDYYKNSVKELNDLLENNTPTELKSHKLVNDLSPKALEYVAKQVTSINDVLSKRIIKG